MLCLRIKGNILLSSAFPATLQRLLATQAAVKLVNDSTKARPFESIPRPNSLKFMSSFLPGGKNHDKSVIELLMNMRDQYGDLFIMPGLFGRKDLVVALDVNDIENVFRNEGPWPHREGFDTVEHFRTKVKPEYYDNLPGLVVTNGEEWSKMRTKVNPALMQPKQMKIYYKPLLATNKEFIERIKEIRHPKTFEVPENFEDDLNRFAFESIAVVGLNKQLGLIREGTEESKELFYNIRRTLQLMYSLDMEPSMWKYIRTPKFFESMRAQKRSIEIISKIVNEALEEIQEKELRGNQSEYPSVLEQLAKYDKRIATVMAMDMLFAGVDTTAVTLGAVLFCLAKHPEKQQKLRDEILRELPNNDVELNESHLKKLPYLRAVVKESMRYYPNGPGTMRTANTELNLSGYQVPKGTNVMVGVNVLCKDERYYEQPNEFVPERWLRENMRTNTNFNPFTYLPFGLGPRMCVGRRIAETELDIAITQLMRHFHIEFDYPADKPFKQSFINVPIIPYKFKFTDLKY